jgi:hypothetical protein
MCAAQKVVLTELVKKCGVPYFGVKHSVLVASIYSLSRRDNPRATDESTHTCETLILFRASRVLLSCSDCEIVSEMSLVFQYSDFRLQ